MSGEAETGEAGQRLGEMTVAIERQPRGEIAPGFADGRRVGFADLRGQGVRDKDENMVGVALPKEASRSVRHRRRRFDQGGGWLERERTYGSRGRVRR